MPSDSVKAFAGIIMAGLAVAMSARADAPSADDKEHNAGVVVIELFTSEGCSSCPAADLALTALREKAQQDGTRIYPIAFHVDYWNRLGWKDRFSTPEASARQRDYATVLGLPSVYTPQMIVNGNVEFVGSDRDRAGREIARALATPASATPTISLANRKVGEPIVIEVSVPAAPVGARLCVVVSEDHLSTDVKAGENSGRRLAHDGVARVFTTGSLGEGNKSAISLTPPGDLKESNASVLVYIQETKTMKVLGAAALPLEVKREPAATTPHEAPSTPAKP